MKVNQYTKRTKHKNHMIITPQMKKNYQKKSTFIISTLDKLRIKENSVL